MSDPKGISILIPVYNLDVTPLVSSLTEQGKNLHIPFEVRCYDDFSSTAFRAKNRILQQLQDVIYLELPQNVGRSAIRNKLASEAQFDHLLFLDGDSEVPGASFLINYFAHISHDVVVGGRIYTPMPASSEYSLHWKAGKAREEKTAAQRAKVPYQSFMTNNFMIRKAVFFDILLDESLEGYGHEDTKFGYRLQEQQIPILHIDNPVIHAWLETNLEFLMKTDEGVKNFYKIMRQGYGHDTKLYKSFRFIRRSGLSGLFEWYYNKRKEHIRKNLLSANPSLLCFDMYKLYRLIEIDDLRMTSDE